MSFTLSAGGTYSGPAKVSDVASDVREGEISGTHYNAGDNTITEYVNPNYATYSTPFTGPVIILSDADDNLVSLYPLVGSVVVPTVQPGNGAPAPAPAAAANGTTTTIHATVKPHRSYRLYLAFPPGTGSVTITKISLANVGK